MVNPAVETTSSEVESSPEVTESLPIDGDQPLIPADFDDRFDDVAIDEVSTGDEATSDDSATESVELPEETPAAETTELPDASTTETAPAEGETPAPRTYSTEEWGNRESSYRTRDTEQTKQLGDLQTEVTQMRDNYQNQLVDARAQGYVTALTQRYTEEGSDPREASDRATREIEAAKADYRTQTENQQLKEQVSQSQQAQETTARNASVERYMRENNVPEIHRDLLQGYNDPALMVRAAEAFGAAEAQRKSTIAAKQAEVPNGGEANSFDGGGGAGGSESDSQWLARYSNDQLPDNTANDERAFKILSARGMAPQF